MYQYDLISVPTGLPVLAYWDEPRRSTYHFTSGVRIRLVRSRCSRHEPQPAAQARPIERACSKTVGGQRLGHFSRSSLVTGTGRFCVVFFISFFAFSLPMPPKSRAAANADRAARAAARAGRSPAPVPPPAAGGGNRDEACNTPSQPAPPAPGSAATPAPMDSVVSPADLSAFPPLEAATSVSSTAVAQSWTTAIDRLDRRNT